MADTLVAKANVGAGLDQLAVDNITGGAAGVVKLALGVPGAVDGYVSATTPMPVAGDFYQATQPVSAAALPLPTGAATEATLDALLDATPALFTTIPPDLTPAPPVRQVPADLWRVGFSSVKSGVESGMTLLQTGGGMAVNQTGGNLVITSGTTANSETLIRSDRTFRGALSMRYKTILSQRIANNNFSVELADIVGSGLSFTINSATSITVTIPSNPFTSENVGQSMNVGQIVGAAGIPGRFAIASVTGNNVDFTVAGWPATGSGTLLLWGYNYHRALYTSTTATNVAFNTQRKGWNTGDSALTINTTASAGHVGQLMTNGQMTSYADSLVATNAGYQFTSRGSRIENLPDDQLELYLFIRVLNGTVAPASTTTWTIGFVSVEMTGRQKVMVAASDQVGGNFAQPVQVMGGALGTQPVSGTVTVNPVVPATPYFVNSAATTNGALILTGTSNLSSLYVTNEGASAAYVKLYNKATAPTVGTDIPEMTFPVPAAAAGVPGVANPNIGFHGFRFALGLGISITRNAVFSDTTAVGAGEVKVKLSRTV